MKSNCTTRCSSLTSTAKSSFGSPCAEIAWDTRTRVSSRVSRAGAARISESLPTISHHRNESWNLIHRMLNQGPKIRGFHECCRVGTLRHVLEDSVVHAGKASQ